MFDGGFGGGSGILIFDRAVTARARLAGLFRRGFGGGGVPSLDSCLDGVSGGGPDLGRGVFTLLLFPEGVLGGDPRLGAVVFTCSLFTDIFARGFDDDGGVLSSDKLANSAMR